MRLQTFKALNAKHILRVFATVTFTSSTMGTALGAPNETSELSYHRDMNVLSVNKEPARPAVMSSANRQSARTVHTEASK